MSTKGKVLFWCLFILIGYGQGVGAVIKIVPSRIEVSYQGRPIYGVVEVVNTSDKKERVRVSIGYVSANERK